MSTNSRKGNRGSTSPRSGGVRRSNTPPPPSVRLGIDGLPEKEPISSARPRNELPKGIPVLQMPPADVVAAAAAASAAPQAPAKAEAPIVRVTPPVAPAVPVAPEPPAEAILSQPGAAPANDAVPGDREDEADSSSPTAPIVKGRKGGDLEGSKRKGRGSNKKGTSAKSIPPAVAAGAAPAAAVEAVAAGIPAAEKPPAGDSAVGSAATLESNKSEPEAKSAQEPPVSAMPMSDLSEKFFDHGERTANDAHEPHSEDASDLDGYDERMAHKNSPEARARREKNWRYLLWVGLGCVVLLVAAVVKNGAAKPEYVPSPTPIVSAGSIPPVTASSAEMVQIEPAAAPSGSALAPSASASAPAGSASGEAMLAPAASASASVSASEPATAPSGSAKAPEPAVVVGEPGKAAGGDPAAPSEPKPVVAEPTDDEKKSAVQAKRACESFLNQNALAKAVESGEHSVSLDPSDGEAWLLLGAAYQAMGKGQEARRSYSSCVAEGKRGPISDCRAMLR